MLPTLLLLAAGLLIPVWLFRKLLNRWGAGDPMEDAQTTMAGWVRKPHQESDYHNSDSSYLGKN